MTGLYRRFLVVLPLFSLAYGSYAQTLPKAAPVGPAAQPLVVAPKPVAPPPVPSPAVAAPTPTVAAAVAVSPGFLAWIKQLVPSEAFVSVEQRPSMRFTLIHQMPENALPQALAMDSNHFKTRSMFEYVDPEAISRNLRANYGSNPENSYRVVVQQVCESSMLHFVVETIRTAGKRWRVFDCNKSFEKPVLVAAPPAKINDASAIVQWLVTGLGFTGKIIDVKGDQLLVLGLSDVFKLRSQAVVIRKSSQSIKFPKKISEGDALVEVKEAFGPYALFRVIIKSEGVENLERGAKVVIQL